MVSVRQHTILLPVEVISAKRSKVLLAISEPARVLM